MLTVAQAANDLATKLGFTNAAAADSAAKQDIIVAINGAMQMLQTAGQDYFTRETVTLNLSAGTSVYNIAKSVQAVIGPLRLNNTKPLRALESEGQYDQFDRIFSGGTGYGAGSGKPTAYWPRSIKEGATGDICRTEIWFAPSPSASHTATVDVVNDAVAYKVADIGSVEELPVAQNYTESIFLPIARMLVTRSSQFSRPDLLAQLTGDAQVAMQRLGVSGGFPNVDQPEEPRRVQA